MRIPLLALTLVLGLTAPAAATEVASLEPSTTERNDIATDYTVGKEDVLEINVLKYADLSGPVTVRPDGKISIKLVGDVQAEGRTVKDINAEIQQRLKEFIPEPYVTTQMRTVNSMKVYVLGRVTAPGAFNIGSNVTLLQALALSKGFTPWAKKNKIVLVRGISGKRVKINYTKVVKGKQDNYILYPGDTIVVP